MIWSPLYYIRLILCSNQTKRIIKVTCFKGKLRLLPHSLHSSLTFFALSATFFQGSIFCSLFEGFTCSSFHEFWFEPFLSPSVVLRLFLLMKTNATTQRSARNNNKRHRIKSLMSSMIDELTTFHFSNLKTASKSFLIGPCLQL